jgi:hypothetical protein
VRQKRLRVEILSYSHHLHYHHNNLQSGISTIQQAHRVPLGPLTQTSVPLQLFQPVAQSRFTEAILCTPQPVLDQVLSGGDTSMPDASLDLDIGNQNTGGSYQLQHANTGIQSEVGLIENDAIWENELYPSILFDESESPGLRLSNLQQECHEDKIKNWKAKWPRISSKIVKQRTLDKGIPIFHSISLYTLYLFVRIVNRRLLFFYNNLNLWPGPRVFLLYLVIHNCLFLVQSTSKRVRSTILSRLIKR